MSTRVDYLLKCERHQEETLFPPMKQKPHIDSTGLGFCYGGDDGEGLHEMLSIDISMGYEN